MVDNSDGDSVMGSIVCTDNITHASNDTSLDVVPYTYLSLNKHDFGDTMGDRTGVLNTESFHQKLL